MKYSLWCFLFGHKVKDCGSPCHCRFCIRCNYEELTNPRGCRSKWWKEHKFSPFGPYNCSECGAEKHSEEVGLNFAPLGLLLMIVLIIKLFL